MATLIIEDGGPRRGGTFNGPLLIGRRPANAVIIDDPSVSHVHAWIGQRNGTFFVSNIASRGHTLVNGELVLGRRKLIDGDRIELGKNTKLTYLEGHDLPRGLTSVELTWRGPMIEDPDIPVVFACQCGATMSITPVFSGSVAKCQFCERMIVVPHPQPPKKKEEQPSPRDTLGNAGDTTDGFGIEWHRFAPGGISTAPLKLNLNPTAASAAAGAVPVANPAVAIPPPRSAPTAKVPVPKAPEPVARIAPEKPAPTPAPVVEKKPEPLPDRIIEKKPEPPAPAPAPIVEKKQEPVAPIAPTPAPVAPVIEKETEPEPPPAPAITPARAPEPVLARVPLLERKTETIQIPAARPAPKPDSIGRCGVCHTDILAGESLTRCSGCSSTFHTDCWVANYGCSSYGCSNVNSLKPDKEDVDPEVEAQVAAAKEADRFPWEFLLLGGSIASFILGALAWGIPSIIVAGAAVFMTIRRGPKRVGILATAGALAILGLLVGLEVSALWWLGRPLDLVRR